MSDSTPPTEETAVDVRLSALVRADLDREVGAIEPERWTAFAASARYRRQRANQDFCFAMQRLLTQTIVEVQMRPRVVSSLVVL